MSGMDEPVFTHREMAAMHERVCKLEKEIPKLIYQRNTMLAALKAVEWINIADEDGYNEREVCSDCQMYKKDGHDSDCQLAKAIAACETGVADNGK